MDNKLYCTEWHLPYGPYLQGYNTKRQALIHAKKCSLDARFGGPIRVLCRTVGKYDYQVVAIFDNGKKIS